MSRSLDFAPLRLLDVFPLLVELARPASILGDRSILGAEERIRPVAFVLPDGLVVINLARHVRHIGFEEIPRRVARAVGPTAVLETATRHSSSSMGV